MIQIFGKTKGALLLALLCALVFALSPLLVRGSPSDFSKIVFVIIAFVPLVLCTSSLVYNYGRVLFNNAKDDDKDVNLFALIITHATWVLSWALVFQIFWVFDDSSCDVGPQYSCSWSNAPPSMDSYQVFVRMLATTLLVSTGTGFGPQVALNWGILLLTGVMAYVSWISVVIVITAGYEIVRDRINSPQGTAQELSSMHSDNMPGLERQYYPRHRQFTTQDNNTLLHFTVSPANEY